MTSEVYVFVDGLEKKPIICGIAALDAQKKIGRFRYGLSYLNRPDAFSLDPINLPLTQDEFVTTTNNGIFGVLSDAGADSWGRRVILSLHTTKPQNELEFLIAGGGMGVGALMFSLSRYSSKSKVNKNTLGDLPHLLQSKEAILNDEDISPEAKRAFEFGSSMGGARPKSLVVDGDVTYLAKFNRNDDLFNFAKVENATMQMLTELPVRVASNKVCETPDGDVLLVKRFESQSLRPTHHFISANSLINLNRVNNQVAASRYSYGFIGEALRNFGSEPRDAVELYWRMVFNVLMGNTDDHARNHGLMYCFTDKSWRLTPAYDVLPISNSRQHGLGIGEQGRFGSIENLLSQSMRFALKPVKARKIIAEVKELTNEWPIYFSRNRVSDGDIERLKGVVPEWE